MNMKHHNLCNVIWLLFFNFSIAFHTLAQGSPLDSDPSLKLHYDFDEDFSNGMVPDLSGNGNVGLQFSTNWITATNGVFGTTGSLWFSNSVIIEPPNTVIQVSEYIGVTNLNGIFMLTNATISMWACFGDTNVIDAAFMMDCGYNVIYASSPSLASNSWTWAKNPYQGALSFWIYPAAGGNVTILTWPNDTVGGNNASTTNFNLYTITIDCPGNRAIAYYNGQPYQTNTIGLPWLKIYGCATQPWLAIGRLVHDMPPGPLKFNGNYAAGFFLGKLDDVRIYNRTLSAAENQSLYTGSVFAQNLTIVKTNSQSVQVLWNGKTNVHYQAESVASLDTNGWASLGPVVAGNGTTNSVNDSTAGHPTQFYRVRVLAK